MFGRKKLDPHERPPYDYREELRLVHEGDLPGLRQHMSGRPVPHGTFSIVFDVVPLVVNCILNAREKEK